MGGPEYMTLGLIDGFARSMSESEVRKSLDIWPSVSPGLTI